MQCPGLLGRLCFTSPDFPTGRRSAMGQPITIAHTLHNNRRWFKLPVLELKPGRYQLRFHIPPIITNAALISAGALAAAVFLAVGLLGANRQSGSRRLIDEVEIEEENYFELTEQMFEKYAKRQTASCTSSISLALCAKLSQCIMGLAKNCIFRRSL